MKKLLIIIFCVISFNSFSQIVVKDRTITLNMDTIHVNTISVSLYEHGTNKSVALIQWYDEGIIHKNNELVYFKNMPDLCYYLEKFGWKYYSYLPVKADPRLPMKDAIVYIFKRDLNK